MAAVGIVAILVGAGVGYVAGVSFQRTVALVSTTTLPEGTVTSTVSAPSMQLFASVKPSIIVSGANVTIIAGVYNPLSTNVTISSSMIFNPSQQPCGLGVVPTGIRLYTGHYTYNNLSSASPLLQYNDTIPIPCSVPYNSTYIFGSHSDRARISISVGWVGNWVTNETIRETGYWTGATWSGGQLLKATFHSFGPGQYTVLVFDAWGQQVLEYFEVSAGSV